MKRVALAKPCADCPFLKVGAIELRPGRVEGIVHDLLADDRVGFACHRTTHRGTEDADGIYTPSGDEKECAGAMIFRLKADRPSVWMRAFAAMKLLRYEDLLKHADKIIEPSAIDANAKEQA